MENNDVDIDAEFNSTEAKVFEILRDFSETRDSDKLLWLKFLELQCAAKEINNSDDPWNSFRQILLNDKTRTMATVIRCRAKIQEKGYFLGEKKQERYIRAEGVSQWALSDAIE